MTIEIEATRGTPYTLTRDNRGVIRLARVTPTGRPIFIVFGADDAVAVADALHDLAEGTA